MTDQYLVWMWQLYSLSLFPCDTLEDAVRLSESIQNAGDGSLECIEGPDGVVPKEAVEEIVDRLEAARAERAADAPTYTHYISLRSPDGKDSAQWDWYTSGDEAALAFAELSERFGDRVSLHEASRV